MNRDALRALLIEDEGLELKPYKDTLGNITIGVGRCLDTKGITEQEAYYLLENDMSFVVAQCRDRISFFNSLDDIRQNVLASLAFNMGMDGLLGFQKMLDAMASQDFVAAADQLMNSKWSAQVGRRAVKLAGMLKNGATLN